MWVRAESPIERGVLNWGDHIGESVCEKQYFIVSTE